MKVPGEPIIKAKPLRGFSHRKAIYIPVDTPSHFFLSLLEKKALRHRKTPYGRFFLLDNSVVLYQAVGAPVAVIGLEQLIAGGVKEIFIFGFCGSLNPDLSALDVVSITKAHSEEGTSGHYIARKKIFDSSSGLRKEIENTLSGRNLPFRQGVTISTDALFRETEIWLRDKLNKGIDVADMEASAVFALGEYHNIPAAALMIVSDELAGKKWKNIFKSPRLNARVKDYFFPFL